MKNFLSVLPLVLLTACGSLIPKPVEFFQSKVKALPVLPDSAKETQKQAAQFVAAKTEETKVAAVTDEAPPSVLVPATEAATVATALSGSLGPPASPWVKPAAPLAEKLGSDLARLNAKVEAYGKKVEPEVGKKIEDTGLVKVGYFTYLLCLLFIGCLIWGAIKIYGLVNPAVGIGAGAVGSVASSVVAKGLNEVVQGGERFKSYLESSTLPTEVKAFVHDIFSRGQMEAQSQDVQNIVTHLTAPTPIASTTPVVPTPPAAK